MLHTVVSLTTEAYPMKGIEFLCPIDQFASMLEQMLTSLDQSQLQPVSTAAPIRRSRPISEVDLHLPLETW